MSRAELRGEKEGEKKEGKKEEVTIPFEGKKGSKSLFGGKRGEKGVSLAIHDQARERGGGERKNALSGLYSVLPRRKKGKKKSTSVPRCIGRKKKKRTRERDFV